MTLRLFVFNVMKQCE